jgi:trimeric autotransporter adhesin
VGPNVAVGQQALERSVHSCRFSSSCQRASNGFGNSGFGYQALANNADGGANTAIGLHALFTNTSGSNNTAIGASALAHNEDDKFERALSIAGLLIFTA